MTMYIAQDNLSPEKLMLEASFTRLVNLFNHFKLVTEHEIQTLQNSIELQEREYELLENEYQTLVDSLKNITVLPDEHDWAQKIKLLRQNVTDLLGEAEDFTAYSEGLLSAYDKLRPSA